MKKKNIRMLAVICALQMIFLLEGCSHVDNSSKNLGIGWQPESSMELDFAENFEVDYYSGGYALISISDGSRYLVAPEDADIPESIDEEIVILQKPIDNIYLVATSAMCLFDALDSIDKIKLSGSRADDWYIENAQTAMEAGDMLYAGKYNAPDYELIMTSGCDLAVESSMIGHAPEVKEKLEDLSVPVLVDQSSYEKHPLGRTEWIKLYAVLVGKETLAKQLFDIQKEYLNSVSGNENTGKTVAFFHISTSGYAVVRKSGDYVTKMIELAGGNYIFKNVGDSESAMSTTNLEMEKFYATAKEADYIIYNSTLGGEIDRIQELIDKNEIIGDFKAVKNGNVWCTEKNLFQETTQLGLMITDINKMLTQGDKGITKLNFMYKLQ